MDNQLTSSPYGKLSQFMVRFCGVFFFLWFLPFPFDIFPWTEKLNGWYGKIWDLAVPIVVKTFFGIARPLQPGSDSTFSLVQYFCFAIIALLATIIWTLVSKHWKNENLLYWLRVYIRYGFAFWILEYAMSKLLKYQFTLPGPMNYTRTYGESSPMGLLWNFMGQSYSYNLFTGFIEAAAAFLLLFRRTSTLGALIAIAAMSNVVILNFSYDVNVKLYSLTALLLAIYLVLPDAKPLYSFFFRMRAASLEHPKPVFIKKSVRYTILGIEVILFMAIAYTKITAGLNLQQHYGDAAPKSPLAGAYKVETFVFNKDTLPPLTTDSIRWDMMVLSGKRLTELKLMNEKRNYFLFHFNEQTNTLKFQNLEDTLKHMDFILKKINPSHITLSGKKENDSIFVSMKKMEFELENHRMKFISDEY